MFGCCLRPVMAVAFLVGVVSLFLVPTSVLAQCGMRALWRFDDRAGTTAADTSPSRLNNGTLSAGATFANDSATDPARGSVINFTGAGNSFMHTGTKPYFSPEVNGSAGTQVTQVGNHDFSFVAWVKTTRNGGVIFSKQSNNDRGFDARE